MQQISTCFWPLQMFYHTKISAAQNAPVSTCTLQLRQDLANFSHNRAHTVVEFSFKAINNVDDNYYSCKLFLSAMVVVCFYIIMAAFNLSQKISSEDAFKLEKQIFIDNHLNHGWQ